MNVILWESVGIVVCLLASAFFSSAETALTSLSDHQAQKLVDERGSTSLKLWIEHPIRVLTAILIGNNICNITASALATALATRTLQYTDAREWAIPLAVGVMTLLLLTFGEITPKALAKRMYKQVSAPMMAVLRVPYVLFYPFTLVFTKMTRWAMKLLGNDPNEKVPFVTSEEIEYMIDLGSREGSFTQDRERLLRSVFDFNDTLVREVMVPRTNTEFLQADLTLEEVVEHVQKCGHSRLPVYEDTVDNIIGIFYVKDLMALVGKPDLSGEFDLRRYVRRPFFVPESKQISDLLAEFQRQRIHIAMVVDEFGGIDGLITLEDIMEEFFGDIQDEYDSETDMLEPITPQRVRADARASIYEINEYFGVSIPVDEDYETIGGFVMAHLGTVPSVGQQVFWETLRITVLEADEKKVMRVEIEQSSEVIEEGGGLVFSEDLAI